MLQALREKTSGWIAFFILAAVSVPFAFFGIEHYFQAKVSSFVAKVGDNEISPDDFRQRLDQYRRQAIQMQGENFDSSYFDSPEVKRQLLERMIDEELLLAAARDANAIASDEALRREIAKIPAFQKDGKFDASQYALLLNSQGMSVQSFQETMREDISRRLLPMQIQSSSFVTDAVIDRYIKLRDQTRDFRYVNVPRENLAPATPSEDEIKAFLDLHQSEFMVPEQVSLKYVEIDAATLNVPENPPEEVLKARYEEDHARFVQPEERLVSHILVSVPADAGADAQKAALAKATELAAKAKTTKDFAALARESSDDLGSKEQGGDLGWLQKGFSDPAFEAALFAMEANTVSEPVKSAEGYHVIQLREVKPEHVKTFEEARAELADEYKNTERQRQYDELASKLIDASQSDTTNLESAANAVNLEIKHTALFGRNGGDGVAAFPAVLKAAFSEDLLTNGLVSDQIELGANHIVLVQVEDHKPSEPQKLDDVRPIVVTRLQMEAAEKATIEKAKKLESRFVAGESLDDLAKELGATVTDAAGSGRSAVAHDPTLISKVFGLARPAEGKPQRAMIELARGSYALVELSKVTEGDPAKVDAAGRDTVRQQLAAGASNSDVTAFIQALRSRYPVEIHEDRM